MLTCLRFVYKATVIVTTIVLFGTYFALLNRPYLGRNILYTPEEEVTVTVGDSSRELTANKYRHRLVEENDRSRPPEYDREREHLKHNLTRRYWALWKSPQNAAVRDDNDRFFTPARLANTSSFYLLRPEDSSRPSHSVFQNDDRVLAQLVLGLEGLPESYVMQTKSIGLLDGFQWWNYGGLGNLKEDPNWCTAFRLNDCQLIDLKTKDIRSYFKRRKPDAVVISQSGASLRGPVGLREDLGIMETTKLIYFLLESPYVFDAEFASPNDWLNSYWRNADINTPYGKWVYYDQKVTSMAQAINHAATKTKMSSTESGNGNGTRARRFAAIFMSNCYAHNARMALVNIFKKHIPVDVYGQCGDMKCPRSSAAECFSRLQKEYKFYLAFENSNCRDYITEKFFQNALQNNVIPVVLGAHPDDYRTLAPRGSYINVEDYVSIQELGSYLEYLDGDEEAYNSYFAWKGTGEFVDTKYWCRVCAMLHYADYLESRGIDWASTSGRDVGAVTSWDPSKQCANDGHVFWNRSKSLMRFSGYGYRGKSESPASVIRTDEQ